MAKTTQKRPQTAAKTETTASPNLADDLREALEALRLPDMLAQLEIELADGPRDGDTRLEFLWRLVEPQLRKRRERAVERRIDEAGFPATKTLEHFDFPFQPKLDRDRIFELATLDFVRRGENLLLGGMSGTGKSHIAIALGHRACRAGIRTLYTTSSQLLATLHASLATGTLADAVKVYTKPQLLIIDELGLDRPEREEARDAQLFYKAIAPRYEAPRSTVITSNLPWDHWSDYLRDEAATVAILDRLLHHGHVITIDGPSFRASEHAKLNQPKPKRTNAKAGH